MGQLCSRPRTVKDKPAAPTDGAAGLSDQHKHNLASLDGQQHVAYTLQPQLETQASEAELSELDVVVQQLRNNHNSVTGSAPELLQQWDHDHKLVLESMDAAIQVHKLLALVHLYCCKLLNGAAPIPPLLTKTEQAYPCLMA